MTLLYSYSFELTIDGAYTYQHLLDNHDKTDVTN